MSRLAAWERHSGNSPDILPRTPHRAAGEPDIAEQLEACEKLGLPPGREHGVPLPVRTGSGGGFDGDESVDARPPTLLAGEMTEPLGEARPTGRPSLCEEAKDRGRAPPGV